MKEENSLQVSLAVINVDLLKLFNKVHEKIDSDKLDPKGCHQLAEEIDWIILRLAQQTQMLRSEESHSLSRMKEFTWKLLESLESYCNLKLNISIW